MIRIAAAVMAWQALILATGLPPFLLPSPMAVAHALWLHRAEIATAAAITGAEIALGFALGAALGTALAIVLGFSDRIAQAVRPALMFSQTIPIFALAPILTLWLGYGMAPKIAIVVLITFFPVMAAMLDGILRTPEDQIGAAMTLGAGRMQIMHRVRIPAAIPPLGTGLRLAAVYAPMGAVIGEWVGGSQGLGALMIHANGRMRMDLVFAALFVLVAMTVGTHAAVTRCTQVRSHRT